MSAAAREAQWISRRTVCAGQATLVQKSSRELPCSVSGCPHEGHSDGGTMSRSSPVRLDASSTPATNGITSPARRTSTVSPILMPRARMTSWLASVARVTVVPPTNTGSSWATGAILPGLADVPDDVGQHRRLLLGGELERQRAARRVRARAGGGERVAVGEPQHRAVEVVVELVALGLDRRR